MALANELLETEFHTEDIEILKDYGVLRKYPKSTILINEGEPGDSLYYILEGKVKVFAGDASGKEVILNIQGPGQYFGELALIDRAPRSASVMTITPCQMSFVTRDGFQACMAEHPRIAVSIIHALSDRVRALTEVVKNLALQPVYGRVASTLTKLAKEREGIFVIDERLTHQDIADMVGASREMVSKIMKDLTIGGYINVKDRTITISGRLPAGY